MRSLFQSFRQLRRRVDGNAAVEYAMLLAGVTAIIVTIVFSMGGTLRAEFKDVCDNISSRMGMPACGDGTPPPAQAAAPAPIAPPAPPSRPRHNDDDDDD
jgi:Flp pilus assembly pilin Flp